MGIRRWLTSFKRKNLAKSKNLSTFAPETAMEYDPDDPVGALATDSGKGPIVLEGEDAERFLRIMEENERKAKERAKIPPTKEELERRLSCVKITYDFDKRQLEEKEKEIKELEEQIKRLEQIDGETKEK